MVPFLLVLLLCLIVSLAVVVPFKLRFHIFSFLSSLTFMSNIWFWRNVDYFSPEQNFNPFLHTWSLSLEWQFYLIFPWIAKLFRIKNSKMIEHILVAIIGLSLSLSLALNISGRFSFTFFNLPTRLFELMIGVLFSYYFRISKFKVQQTRVKSFFLILVLSVYLSQLLFDYLQPFHPHMGSFVLSLLTGFLLYFFSGGTPVSNLFNSPIFTYLGEISYSFYLWHLPVISLLNTFYSSKPKILSFIFLPILITFGLSALTHRFIESKRKFWSFRKALILYAISVIFGVVVFFW